MNIKLDGYLIEVDSIQGFNLFEVSISNGEKTKGKEVRNIIGYNMPIERCIWNIIHNNLQKQQVDVTLNEFLDAYKAETEKISALFKDVKY